MSLNLEKCETCPIKDIVDKPCYGKEANICKVVALRKDLQEVVKRQSLGTQEKPKEHQLPSLFQQAQNFGKSVINNIQSVSSGKPLYVIDEVKQKRLSICDGCEFKTQTGRCSECGCFLGSKTALAAERCPIGKWKEDFSSVIKNDQIGDCNCLQPIDMD